MESFAVVIHNAIKERRVERQEVGILGGESGRRSTGESDLSCFNEIESNGDDLASGGKQ